MTLAQAAAVLGTVPKWIQNALAQLGLGLTYPETAMRRLGLAHRLVRAGFTLQAAWDLAGKALETPGRPAQLARDHIVTVTIDVPRYLTEWTVAWSRVRHVTPVRGRGRPRVTRRPGGVARAHAYGIDVPGLRNNLKKPVAERLRTLDENQQFIARLRERRP